MLTISETSIQITDRFFEAIEELKKLKKLRGLQTFTKRHGLNQGNMSTLKNNRSIRAIKPEYLALLAEDFGVSCEWLLLGKGEMFTPMCSKNEESQSHET